MNISRIKNQNGYTLLFAVLVSALVLGVAVFILSVSTKQYQLSAAARNSVYSFYAADSGIECAVAAYYGDLVNGTYGSIDASSPVTISCNGTTHSGVSWSGPVDGAVSGTPLTKSVYSTVPGVLDFNLPGSPVGTCVRLVVYDGYDSASPTPNHYTVIDARGYNECTSSGGPDTSNPATVERALRLTLKG